MVVVVVGAQLSLSGRVLPNMHEALGPIRSPSTPLHPRCDCSVDCPKCWLVLDQVLPQLSVPSSLSTALHGRCLVCQLRKQAPAGSEGYKDWPRDLILKPVLVTSGRRNVETWGAPCTEEGASLSRHSSGQEMAPALP